MTALSLADGALAGAEQRLVLHWGVDRGRYLRRVAWGGDGQEDTWNAKNEDSKRQESREHRTTPFLGGYPLKLPSCSLSLTSIDSRSTLSPQLLEAVVVYLGIMPVSVKKHFFYLSLSHATQQQKLQSSPRFGVFKADYPTRFLLIRRSVFFTDTGMT